MLAWVVGCRVQSAAARVSSASLQLMSLHALLWLCAGWLGVQGSEAARATAQLAARAGLGSETQAAPRHCAHLQAEVRHRA